MQALNRAHDLETAADVDDGADAGERTLTYSMITVRADAGNTTVAQESKAIDNINVVHCAI